MAHDPRYPFDRSGRVIRRLRQDKGMSQEDLADATLRFGAKHSVCPRTVQRAEMGGRVQTRKMFGIAMALETRPSIIWPEKKRAAPVEKVAA